MKNCRDSKAAHWNYLLSIPYGFGMQYVLVEIRIINSLITHKEINVSTLKQTLRMTGSALLLVLFAHNAQSAVVLDGFTDVQYAENGAQYSDRNHINEINGLSITNTVLNHAYRTLTATAVPDEFTDISVIGGKLTIDNTGFGDAGVLYRFDTFDLTKFAKAIAINVSFIDQYVNVQLIGNGSSKSSIHTINSVGQYFIEFAEFTNPLAFSQLESFELQFQGPEGWDAQFNVLATDTKVPEPSITALLLIGLIALGIRARRDVFTA